MQHEFALNSVIKITAKIQEGKVVEGLSFWFVFGIGKERGIVDDKAN